ncbi:VOC family protein [Anaerorhabdus sp.]|jgi:PhnB protein|uniref:VOC family protein n=1 Tax=Anaerorhabdus sp. TaxID=1872524 RepID=UPI002FC80F41
MSVNIYFNFDGNCAEAVNYYADIFNVEANIMKFGEMSSNPGFPLSEEVKKRVIHANINIEGNKLMFSDIMPDMEYIVGNNLSIIINTKDKEKLTDWFNKLAQDGFIVMPLTETFFSDLYGFVKDKYGVGWQFNLEKEL